MAVARELGYELPPRNKFHQWVGAAMATRPGAWVGYRVVPALDRASLSISGGRGTVTRWLAGVPPLWLETVGAVSGEPRRTPLIGIPVESDLALIGTSFGQPKTPSWAHNLEANPAARITFREQGVDVLARRVDAEEEAAVWEASALVYPGFLAYRERLSRQVRIFVLNPR